ncbi:hypothetical protein PACTADRAFT_29100, partial [Pachysolen tannophilus NRRL Y-2460]
YSLPNISTFYALTTDEQIELLNHLFEPCPTLTSLLIPELSKYSKFNNYKELIETVRSYLLSLLAAKDQSSSIDRINKIISAHPRLGPQKTPNSKLSSHSSSEQKNLSSSPEDAKRLAEMNDLYEKTFPGLRYVVFVNGRSRDIIIENMIMRIKRNDIELEKIEAFNAMCDIALDRAAKL